MSDQPKEVPRRSAYKAVEVCEIAHIQPYVLRSWEAEFPRLGVVRSGVRVYRHADLEQVVRIRQLVFDEGLTLAGARRRIEEDREPQPELPLDEPITPEMRQRIGHVRQGLEQLLSMLGGPADAQRPAEDGDGTARLAGIELESPTERVEAPAVAKKRPRKTPSGARPKAGRSRGRHAGRA